MHIHKTFFTLKHLKLLQHVSIFLDHPQGATLFLAKITFFFKKYTHWLLSYINLVLWQHVILCKFYVTESASGCVYRVLCNWWLILARNRVAPWGWSKKTETYWSNFKCFNLKKFYLCALVGVLIKWFYEMHGATIKTLHLLLWW